jgi:hypothetical protein
MKASERERERPLEMRGVDGDDSRRVIIIIIICIRRAVVEVKRGARAALIWTFCARRCNAGRKKSNKKRDEGFESVTVRIKRATRCFMMGVKITPAPLSPARAKSAEKELSAA